MAPYMSTFSRNGKVQKKYEKVRNGHPEKYGTSTKKYDPQNRKIQSTKKVRYKYDFGGLRPQIVLFYVLFRTLYFPNLRVILFSYFFRTFPDARFVLFSYIFRTLPFHEKVLI